MIIVSRRVTTSHSGLFVVQLVHPIRFGEGTAVPYFQLFVLLYTIPHGNHESQLYESRRLLSSTKRTDWARESDQHTQGHCWLTPATCKPQRSILRRYASIVSRLAVVLTRDKNFLGSAFVALLLGGMTCTMAEASLDVGLVEDSVSEECGRSRIACQEWQWGEVRGAVLVS